eukprot:SAG22_NODE_7049_length_782_cov_0.701318_1_plen_82_part_10
MLDGPSTIDFDGYYGNNQVRNQPFCVVRSVRTLFYFVPCFCSSAAQHFSKCLSQSSAVSFSASFFNTAADRSQHRSAPSCGL